MSYFEIEDTWIKKKIMKKITHVQKKISVQYKYEVHFRGAL